MGEKGLQRNESQAKLQRLSLKDIQNIVGEAGTKEPKEGFEMVFSSIVFPRAETKLSFIIGIS